MSYLPRLPSFQTASAHARTSARAAAGGSPGATTGSVQIVGAGPGSPDLLTLRALDCLRRADVVVHDRLVDARVLAFVRPGAQRICVAKVPGRHSWRQDEINALLVRLARKGARVVRLKGGDPFVFGRGGEEVAYLSRHGVAVEVVPGVTAAAAAAAAAAVPLTHRGVASTVTFVTGHGRDGLPDLDWAALARLRGTLAVYMGVANAGPLARRLIAHGLAPATPVAVVENASRPDERVARGTLGGLARLIRDHRIVAPALILIGEAAGLGAVAEAAAEPARAAAV